ncbi:MAG: hypothetical protein CMO55_12015 [Verrucomicrobiales bacterium]|nr:hypothetical protein [Verrucomicrobiales bacterium]
MIIGSWFIYSYKKPHYISDTSSEDGNKIVKIHAKRNSWLFEGFDVLATISSRSGKPLDEQITIDEVDLLSDAREAYESPQWFEDEITFVPSRSAMDKPIAIKINRTNGALELK